MFVQKLFLESAYLLSSEFSWSQKLIWLLIPYKARCDTMFQLFAACDFNFELENFLSKRNALWHVFTLVIEINLGLALLALKTYAFSACVNSVSQLSLTNHSGSAIIVINICAHCSRIGIVVTIDFEIFLFVCFVWIMNLIQFTTQDA